jgi:hypothetical protein
VVYPVVEWQKLYKDMTTWERRKISNIINNNEFRFNTYSWSRLRERSINKSDVYKTINNYEIIEYHFKNFQHRILIRGKEVVNNKIICVVLDLVEKTIVTVYKNDIDDIHESLHQNWYYNGELKWTISLN